MKCLALDIGSSSIKGAVFDTEQRQLGQIATRPFPAPLSGLPSLHFEVDAHNIEAAARGVIDSLLANEPDVRRLYVAGQMGGLVLLGDDGQPHSNYLSWRDQRTLAGDDRGASFLQFLRERLGDDLYYTLGNELQAGSTPALLAWLNEKQFLPPAAIPVTVADYVVSRLCGIPGQMHVTHAVSLLELRTCDWHFEALTELGLEGLNLPRLIRAVEPVGSFHSAGREVEVFGAYGDQQCALLGAGLQSDELSINVSTGSQVSRLADQLRKGDFQTRAYFGGRLLQTITHLPAGRSLNVLVDLLGELAAAEQTPLRDAWRNINRLTEEAAQRSESKVAGLAADLSFFAGAFGSSGSITGITTENLSVGNLFLAALRSMAENYGLCAERLDPTRSCRRIALSGSLARSSTVLRVEIEQRIGLPLRDAAGDEETLLGLLKLAVDGEQPSQPATHNK